MTRFLIFLIAGWSGFFIMAIELLGGRLLAPYFGNSIHVWGAVITVFMLALAIGYLLGGRLSVKDPSLHTLSFLLLGCAAASTPVMLVGDGVMEAVFTSIHDSRYGAMASATILFFIPTLVAGMVPPYAVRLLVSENRLSGHYAGILYFVSTLGSAAGTLITSFYLVLYLEIYQILWCMVGTSAALVVLTLLLGAASRPARVCSRISCFLSECENRIPLFPASLRLVLLRMINHENN